MTLLSWSLLGCGAAPPPPPAPPPDLDAEARDAAVIFWRCFERDGVECRPREAPYRAWRALRMLMMVRDGSPTVMVDELPRCLAELEDESVARRAFIKDLAVHEALAPRLTCHAAEVTAVGHDVDALVTAARRRVERLGLGDTATGGAIGALSEVARVLGQAREVRLSCSGDYALYLVVAPSPQGSWQALSIGTAPINVSSGNAGPVTPVTIDPGVTHAIDPWLPVGESEL